MAEVGSHLQYFISGGGCGVDKLRQATPYRVWGKKSPGFMTVEATPCSMTVSVITTPTARPHETVYTTTIPNYRQQWLQEHRGIPSKCGVLPQDPHLKVPAGVTAVGIPDVGQLDGQLDGEECPRGDQWPALVGAGD